MVRGLFWTLVIINIPLHVEKDSILFYAAKFGQYANMTEYNTTRTAFTIKGTDRIIQRYHFDTVENLLNADSRRIPNGNDLNLANLYSLTIEQLNENRILIRELENIKQRFLSNITDDGARFSSHRRSGRRERYAFVIYNLQRLQRNIPTTPAGFINNVRQEFGDNHIMQILNFDPSIIAEVFDQVLQIRNQFAISDDSFFRK